MKKIVIFGATGATGVVVLETALKKGYEVTAFVRDPSKIPSGLQVNRVIKGDVLVKENVDEAVQGQDGVVIVLGTRNDLSPSTYMSEGTKNIVASMEKHSVKRVTCCISSFLFWDPSKIPATYGPITEDHRRMLEALKSSSAEWVAILPPHISNDPPPAKYELANDAPVGRVISRSDLAEILISCLTDDARIRHTVGMGYP